MNHSTTHHTMQLCKVSYYESSMNNFFKIIFIFIFVVVVEYLKQTIADGDLHCSFCSKLDYIIYA